MEHTPQFVEFAGWRCQVGQPRQGLLTEKQGMVIAGMAAGWTQKEIARARGISPATVKTTAEKVYHSLRASRATDAIAKAMRRGWIAPLVLVLLVADLNGTTLRVRQPVRTRQPLAATSRIARRDLGSVFA